MGYTHYCYQDRVLEPENFKKVVVDFKKMIPILEHLGVKLAGPIGIGKPIITRKEIRFNGLEKCGHVERDLGIAWASKNAKGIAPDSGMTRSQNIADETWFAGLQLNSRMCGGDCSHETFSLAQGFETVMTRFDGSTWEKEPTQKVQYINSDGTERLNDPKSVGKFFEFCKTAYKPYDLAVNVCLIIAKHYLKDQILVHSDGELENWKDGMELCQHFLGYGDNFDLDKEEEI